MPFDISAGFSAMGGAVAKSAGDAALEQQKSDLESQKLVLADQLTTRRETTLEAQRQTGATALAKTTSDLGVSAHKAEADDDAARALQQAPALAAVNAKILKDNANDPAWVRAQRTIVDASATPEQRAMATDYQQKTIADTLANAAAKEVEDSRAQLKAATTSGDNAQIVAAERRMAVATYSAKDEVQAAAAAKGMADTAEHYVSDIDARIARIQSSPEAESDSGKTQLAALNSERGRAASMYDERVAEANAAAKNIPTINIGADTPKAAPAPLTEGATLKQAGHIFKVIGGKAVDQGPDPAAKPAGGIINAPSGN